MNQVNSGAWLAALGFGVLAGLSGCIRLQGVPDVIVQIPAEALAAPAPAAPGTPPVDFTTQIKPLLESKCLGCHHGQSNFNTLPMTRREYLIKGADGRQLVVPGKPERSSLYLVTVVPEYFVEAMPPVGFEHRLTDEEVSLLYRWIKEGAKWPARDALEPADGEMAIRDGAL